MEIYLITTNGDCAFESTLSDPADSELNQFSVSDSSIPMFQWTFSAEVLEADSNYPKRVTKVSDAKLSLSTDTIERIGNYSFEFIVTDAENGESFSKNFTV